MSKEFFSKEEFQERWKKVRDSMKKFGILVFLFKVYFPITVK